MHDIDDQSRFEMVKQAMACEPEIIPNFVRSSPNIIIDAMRVLSSEGLDALDVVQQYFSKHGCPYDAGVIAHLFALAKDPDHRNAYPPNSTLGRFRQA